MITLYLDESGYDDASTSFWVAGNVATAKTWFEVQRLWRRALDARGIAVFHMVELAGSRSAFLGWTADQRRELLEELIDILTTQEVVGLGAGVVKSAYQTLVVDSGFLENSRFTHAWWHQPLLLPFQDCLAEALRECQLAPRDETLTVIADRQDEFAARATAVFEYLKSDRRLEDRFRLASLSFLPKTEALPLQAADLLVYELRKNFDRRTFTPGAPLRISFDRLAARVRSSRYYDEEGIRDLFISPYEALVRSTDDARSGLTPG